MGHQLPPQEIALYRRMDEVLHYMWDPIGVAGVPEARDEYDGYLPQVYQLLVAGDESGLRAFLQRVTEDRMGIAFSEYQQVRVEQTLDALREWKRKIAQDGK